MKSIVEEASSVVKAVERAWIRAGKPHEFTIKIFEEAQKNFIGITTKSAKIGLFFQDILASAAEHKEKQPHKAYERQSSEPAYKKQVRKEQSENIPIPSKHKEPKIAHEAIEKHPQQKNQDRPRSEWTDQMVETAHHWIQQSCNFITKNPVAIEEKVNRNLLTIRIKGGLTDDIEKDRTICRSFSHLLMESLSQKFKEGVRFLRVRVVHEA